MADIDRLDIIISAEASKAEKQLNKLMTALGKLSATLNGLNTSGLTGLANSVQRLSVAMQGMNAVRTADFTRLAKNIQKLSGIDTKSLNAAASSMNIIGKALSGLGTASANAQQIGEMAKNLSKLGNKGIQNAITNMPQLASSLKNMMQVLQSTPRVSSNLIRMTEAMGKLASNGNRVGSAARSLNSGFKSYGSYSDTATRKTRSLASAIGLLYAKFWVLQRALKGLFSAIEKSMDFSESVNYFEVAMRKIGDDASRKWRENGYDSAEAYSESFSKRLRELSAKMTGFQIDSDGNAVLTNQKNLGLDPDKVLQYQAQYAQMADSIGMTEEAALNTSKALTMLGADWASLRNISFDQAWEKFASALAGQSRAVRSLGIDITQATLQEYAYKYGLTGAVSEMNQAIKAQLRLLAILDQSKVAFGDLANTIQSPANQLRILQQNFGNLARIIGNIFLPVVAKVLPYINGVVIALQRLFQWISKLLGIKLTGINTSIGGMSDAIADLGEEDGIDNVTNNADDASNAIDKANDSAKKLKRTILGFDELNVLNDNSENDYNSSASNNKTSLPSIGGSDILDTAISDALADYEKAWNDAFDRMENKAVSFADKLTSSFKKLWKVAEPTRKAIKKLWDEGLSKLGKFSWTALKDFYSEFLVPVGRWALGKGIPDLVNATNDFLNKIDWTRINKSLKEFWKALAPFAENVGDGIIEFYNDLTSIGADFINKVVPGGLDALSNALKKISPETAEKIGYGLGVLFTSISAFKGITWIGRILGAGSPLAKGLSLLAQHPYAALAVGIGGVVVALDKFGIIDVDWDWLWAKIGQIKDILAEFIDKIDFETLSSAIGNLWDAFQPFAEGFADGFIGAFDILVNDIGAPLINGISKALKGFSIILSSIPPEVWKAVGEALGAIVAVKIPLDFAYKIFGISSAFNMLKTVLGKGKLATGMAETTEAIKNIGNVAGGASGGFGGLVSSIVPLVGAAGLIVGVGAACEQAFEGLAKFIDKFRGGNGEISEFGGAMDSFIQILSSRGDILSGTAEELSLLKESLEKENMTAEETKNATQHVIDKLGEYGVTTDQAAQALNLLYGQQVISDDMMKILSESVKSLGDETTNMAGQIDLSSLTAEEAYERLTEAVGAVSNSSANASQNMGNLLIALDNSIVPGATAQDAFNNVMKAADELGINTETVAKIFAEKFPEAVQTAKKEVDTSTRGIKTAVDTNIVGASKTIKTESASIEKNVKGAMNASGKAVSDTMGGIDSNTGNAWGNSSGYIAKSLKIMKSDTSTGMQQVFKNVESYMTSIYNVITNKFRWAGDRVNTLLGDMSENVGSILGGMNSDAQQSVNQIANSFSNLGYKIQNSIGDLSGYGRNAAQSFANGFRSVYIPTPHLSVSSWDKHYLNAERTSWYNTPNYSVRWYASGGFPNAGELFMARESGPELVGRMGHKNAVANNNQIVDGIKAGVYEAVRDAVFSVGCGTNGKDTNVTVVLEGDAKGLFKVVKTEGDKYQKSTGKPVFA